MWLKRPGFMDVVGTNWAVPIEGFGMRLFSFKLKRLKGVLKTWNKEHFGNIQYNVRQAELDVRAKELSYSHSGSASDLVALNHAQAIYARSLVEEETFWKQKARVRWLDEGDRKTSFFHSSVALKKARLSIGRIKNASGIWTEDPGEIGQKAVGFFQSLLAPQLSTLDESKAGRFLDFIPSLISFEDNAALLRPISLEEVKEAVVLAGW